MPVEKVHGHHREGLLELAHTLPVVLDQLRQAVGEEAAAVAEGQGPKKCNAIIFSDDLLMGEASYCGYAELISEMARDTGP